MDEYPNFLRALLVADGTVTKLIEAYFQENLQVVLHQQQAISRQLAPAGLHVLPSAQYLHRNISLLGERSSLVYLTAESWIDLNQFDDQAQQAFLAAKIGIGEILQQFMLATYRKITQVFSGEENQQTFIGRTYVIYVAQKPAIQITEKFPLKVYREV